MPRRLSFTILIILPAIAFSQLQDWSAINAKRLHTTEKSMLVLGSWAVANITGGLIMRNATSGTSQYFHEMNALWNTANLGIATLGYVLSRKADPASFSPVQTVKAQRNIENILLLNTGLDTGYMMAGLYLRERGKNRGSDRLMGYGDSLLLQGGFLLVFDLIQFYLHKKQSTRMLDWLDHVAFDGRQIGLRIALGK